MKVVLLGIDGLDLNLLKRLVNEGKLPNFKHIIENGASGGIWSPPPPLSPAIWVSIATGQSRLQHGVFDFIEFVIDKQKYLRPKTIIHTSEILRGRSVWDHLSITGYNSLVVNYPFTYPPYKIKGVMISGFPSPSQDIEVYPSSLKNDLKKIVPRYTTEYIPPDKLQGSSDVKKMIEVAKRNIMNRVKIWGFLANTYKFDFSSLVITELDRIQHKIFGLEEYLDLLVDFYIFLDKILFVLLNKIRDLNANLIILSDHGFESLKKFISLPRLLEKLHVRFMSNPFASSVRSKTFQRVTFSTTKIKFLNILLEKTRKKIWKYVDIINASRLGKAQFLIRNNYCLDSLTATYKDVFKIKKRLEEQRDEDNGSNIFEEIFTKYEYIQYVLHHFGIYNCLDAEKKHFYRSVPDLILVPRPGYELTLDKLKKTFMETNSSKKGVIKHGTHYSMQTLFGVFLAYGPQVIKQDTNWQLKMNVIDIAPTILALYGIQPPRVMYGRILNNVFTISNKLTPLEKEYLKHKIKRLKRWKGRL